MPRVLLTLFGVALLCGVSGCAVITVVDTAVDVAATAVKVGATVVETTVDVAATGVKAAAKAVDKATDAPPVTEPAARP